MGGQPYLDELRRDLKNEGLDYALAALASAADADGHVAMLSRRPLTNVRTHTDLEFAYFGGRESVKRGLLEATVATWTGDVTIFALHLKSRFTERPDNPHDAIRRAGEATAIRDRVLKRFPAPAEARFLIIGDCNTTERARRLSTSKNAARPTSPISCRPPIRGARQGRSIFAARKIFRMSTTSWFQPGYAMTWSVEPRGSSTERACAGRATTGRWSLTLALDQ